MIQVKIFDKITAKDLEAAVNKFIEENNGHINVKDIKYTSFTDDYSAMIIYETIW